MSDAAPPTTPLVRVGSASSARRPVRPDSAVSSSTQRSKAPPPSPPSEVIVGTVRIGPDGISSTDGAQLLSSPTIGIDELEFRRELGRGAQGVVSLYYLKGSNGARKYAVKSIRLSQRDQIGRPADGRKEIIPEIRNMFSIHSDNIVRVHNAHLRDGKLLLVQEYMDGGNLEDLLRFRSPLPEPAVAYIAQQILRGLAQIHAKQRFIDKDGEYSLIHRDLSLRNVLLGKKGAVRLADFGVAGLDHGSVGAQSIVGTVVYHSPQRIREGRYTAKCDIWSAGVLFCEMLLGRYPFLGGNKTSGNVMALIEDICKTDGVPTGFDGAADAPPVSPEGRDFVNACLRQEERDRPSADALLQHPWIERFASDGSAVLVEILAERSTQRHAKALERQQSSHSSLGA